MDAPGVPLMRMILRATLVCSFVALIGVAPAVSQSVKSDQDILVQLERDWDAAFHRHDVAFIDRILAEEFIVTYDNGVRADRKTELELAASLNENIESSSLDEFIVKEYGNTAIVWFT